MQPKIPTFFQLSAAALERIKRLAYSRRISEVSVVEELLTSEDWPPSVSRLRDAVREDREGRGALLTFRGKLTPDQRVQVDRKADIAGVSRSTLLEMVVLHAAEGEQLKSSSWLQRNPNKGREIAGSAL